jgi:hypothetical protein
VAQRHRPDDNRHRNTADAAAAGTTREVNPANADRRVMAHYAFWGYRALGSARSSPRVPALTVMTRPVRPGPGI